MALTDLTRISTSGIATGSTIDSPILRKDVSFRGTQVGVTSALFDSSDDALEFNDNVQLKFGNSGDLALYHTGSHSYIQENGSGNLILDTNGFSIKLTYDDSDNMLRAIRNQQVELFYDNDLKFETTKHGASVTGILTATGFSGPVVGNTSNSSGISTFYDLRVTNNLTVEGTTTTLDTDLTAVDRIEVGANSNSVVGVAITQSGTADIVNLFDGGTEIVEVASSTNAVKVTHSGGYGLRVQRGSKFLDFNGDWATSGSAAINAGASGIRFYYGDSSDGIQFNTGSGGDKVRITSTGDVGIGTTNPFTTGALSSHQLTIKDDNPVMGIGKNNSDMLYLRREFAAGNYTFQTFNGGNAGFFLIQPYGGKVGIGTNNPLRDFHVTGTSRFEQLDVVGFATFGSAGTRFYHHIPRIEMPGSNTATISFCNATTGITNNDGMLMGFSSSSQVGFINVNEPSHGFVLKTGSSAVSAERLRVSGVGTFSIRNGTEEMILAKPNGAVELYYNNIKRLETTGTGVDITDTLKVAGISTFVGNAQFDSKVGIGTDNPTYVLHTMADGVVGSTENDRKYNGRFTTHAGNRLNLDIYDRRWQDTQTHGWLGTEKRIEYNVDSNTAKRMWMSFFNANSTVASNVIRFGEQEDTEWMRIFDGKVGIGSANPESKLTVAAGSATAQIEIQRTNGSGGGTIGVLNFTGVTGYSVANISALGQGDNDGAHLVFRTTGSAGEHSPFGGSTNEHLRITSGGKIGIATATPTAKLTIGRVTGGYMNTTGIQVNRPHSLGLQNGVLVYTDAGFNNTATYRAAAFKAVGTSGIAFAVSTDAGNNGLGGTLNAKIDFDGDAHFLGNTGIGTDSPLSRLDVRNASGTNPLLRLHHSNADVEGEVIRIGRTELPTIRYHSIKAKHSGNSLANYISVNVHDGGGNPYTSQTEVARFLGAGGMTFNGDTTTANALDDYEEGSWTPTVLSEGNIGTPQYTCTYTKIGRLVTINADIHQLSDTTSNTDIKIGGLPYVPTRTNGNWSAVCHGERYGGSDIIVAYLLYNSGSWGIGFRFGVPTNHYSYVKHSNISDNGDDNNLRFTLTYELAS